MPRIVAMAEEREPQAGMAPEYRAIYAGLEQDHWWWQARRRIVLAQVQRFCQALERPRVIEIGCASAQTLLALSDEYDCLGIEPDAGFAAEARERGFEVRSGALPDDLPEDLEPADVVLLLDVLEHVEADAEALRACARLLRPEGRVLLTAPALPWLWSSHDEINGHLRRYTVSSLKRAADAADLHVHYVSYYNFGLFPVLAAARLAERLRRRQASGRLPQTPGTLVNRLLRAIMASEAPLLGRLCLPWGSSILAWIGPRPRP